MWLAHQRHPMVATLRVRASLPKVGCSFVTCMGGWAREVGSPTGSEVAGTLSGATIRSCVRSNWGTPRGIPRGAATRRPCLMVSRHPQRPGSLTPHRPDGDTIAIHRIWATARPCRRDGREPSPATWPSAHPSRSRLVGASGRHRASHLLRYRCLEAPRKHWPLVRSSVRHLRSGGLQSPRGR